jgi:hypothetical protein
MGRGALGEVLGAVFLLALAALLVRPGSYAPTFVKAFGDAMTEIVHFAVSG